MTALTQPLADGNLITVGGDNDPFSPNLPTTPNDHERYNLVPYLSLGDTGFTVTNANASLDDNIFLALFHITGEAVVICQERCTVPEPGSRCAAWTGTRRNRTAPSSARASSALKIRLA